MNLVVFRQDNAYFAKNEQSSIAIFTALAEHNLIEPKL